MPVLKVVDFPKPQTALGALSMYDSDDYAVYGLYSSCPGTPNCVVRLTRELQGKRVVVLCSAGGAREGMCG